VTGIQVEVHGAEQLAALSRRLKAAGEKGLQRELSRGIAKAMQPVKRALPASARDRLPKRGGFAEQVARSKLRTIRRNSGRAVGLRLQASNPENIRRADKGQVRHPTFGHGPWVTQQVKPGWFTEPTQAAAPAVRAEVEAAQARVVAQIDGRVTPP
jgi:hypothetical protein